MGVVLGISSDSSVLLEVGAGNITVGESILSTLVRYVLV